MANKRSLWELHLLAKTYSQRPSEIVGIQDDWAAYQFDVAAMTLANEIETGLMNKKDIHDLLRNSGEPEDVSKRVRRGEFKDPRSMMRQKQS